MIEASWSCTSSRASSFQATFPLIKCFHSHPRWKLRIKNSTGVDSKIKIKEFCCFVFLWILLFPLRLNLLYMYFIFIVIVQYFFRLNFFSFSVGYLRFSTRAKWRVDTVVCLPSGSWTWAYSAFPWISVTSSTSRSYFESTIEIFKIQWERV